MCSIVNKTDFINPKWNSYDRTVAKAQLSNFGCIFLDEYGCPNDRFITELPDDIEDICQGVLYNFCIMEDNNHLKKASWNDIVCFCHIDSDKSLIALNVLKARGYIDYREKGNGYCNFSITQKGLEKGKLYIQ